MDLSWDESRRAFHDATRAFLSTAARVGDRWNDPGLGEWDIRSLVGHTSRALATVEEYLSRPVAAAEITSAAGYYRAADSLVTGPAVAARGRDAGAALGAHPVAALSELAERVLALIEDRTGDELMTTVAGGMRLADYLPTRSFELTVHTADLAAALGIRPDLPPRAAAQALHLVAELAAGSGRAAPLLLAATGRPGLPAGYSVL
ncbi:MAG TPA: maleylpyruvate isomerase N-terminal domain-containing protein [Mycobacteriales bacterium]|nr:maleylpyruvate isomerase N-terminal domain-containing protein [Mycobacteriales bacterium]